MIALNFYYVSELFQQEYIDILRPPASLSAPDRDGDLLYDLNIYMSWLVMAEDSSSILMQLLYLDVEKTSLCSRDRLQVWAACFKIPKWPQEHYGII